MKKVLVYFYSQGNLGDDLFVNIINNRYKNKLEFISRINPLFDHLEDIRIHNNGLTWLVLKLIGRVVRRNIYLELLLRRNDLLLYIGGSIFIENNGPNNIKKWRKEAKFYSKLNKPYYILGANFGPYIRNEFISITRKILSKAEDVCFRDSKSHEIFKDLKNVRHSSDIVFSMNEKVYKITTEKKVVFSIIDCSNHFQDERINKYELEIMKLTKRFVNDGYQVVYMSFCKHEGDEKIIEKIISKLPQDIASKIKSHYYRGDINKSLQEIASSEFVVATRFHAVILGLLFSKRVLPMIYSGKTKNILADMKFRGATYDISDMSQDSDCIEISKIAKHDINKQRVLAEKQFEMLDDVLDKR